MCSHLLKIAPFLQYHADLLEQFLTKTTFLSRGQPSTLTHFSVINKFNNQTEVSAGSTDFIKGPQQTFNL